MSRGSAWRPVVNRRAEHASESSSASTVHSGQISVEGRTIDLLSAGCLGSAPPIVMLPGLGYPGMLLPWMRRLAGWTEVTLLDLPGWRRGRATGCAPSIGGVADAARRALPRVAGSPPILIGHSTAAQAALQVATTAPDRLAGLVLAGPTVDPGARTWPRLVGRFVGPLWREPPTELAAVWRSMLSGGIRPIVHLVGSALADRPEQRIAGVRVPTLILTGQHDRVSSPSWCRHLAQLAAGSFRILPGAHNCCFSHPVSAAEAVRDALSTW